MGVVKRGATATEKTDRPPKHILVVNDTEEILDLFRDILEGMGPLSWHRETSSREATPWPREIERSARTAAVREGSLPDWARPLRWACGKAAWGTSAWTIAECNSR
jgi:CheY-like chemotaxis protein